MNGPLARLGLGFNTYFEKYMFLVVPVALLLGFAWSGPFGSLTGWVPWLFGYLTFVMALGCSPRQVADALRMPGTILLTLAIVHIVAPPAAYGLGALLFGHDSPFVIGFVLFAVIPLGVSSVIWVGVAGGNVPLALSLIVLDSALSPFVVPAEIAFFFGKGISFDHWKMMSDLLLIVVVPTIVGVAVNALTGGRVKTSWGPAALPLSKISFFLVVLINAAAIAPQIGAIKSDVPVLLPAVLVLVAFCYAIGYAGSAGLRNDSLTATLLYASGMRNISLGVVIGLAYFEPRAAVPVVLAILVQQPMATLMYTLVKWSQKRFGSRAQSAG